MLAPSAALSNRCKSYLLWTFLLFSWTKCLGQPSVTVSPHSGPPTSTSVVSGKGFGAYKVVDIFFDTTDEALVVANGSGTFSGIAVSTPASAKPGTHWISAVQRAGKVGAQVSFLVSTNWSQFHFARDHTGSPGSPRGAIHLPLYYVARGAAAALLHSSGTTPYSNHTSGV
jgi:hypothetical protein